MFVRSCSKTSLLVVISIPFVGGVLHERTSPSTPAASTTHIRQDAQGVVLEI